MTEAVARLTITLLPLIHVGRPRAPFRDPRTMAVPAHRGREGDHREYERTARCIATKGLVRPSLLELATTAFDIAKVTVRGESGYARSLRWRFCFRAVDEAITKGARAILMMFSMFACSYRKSRCNRRLYISHARSREQK